MSELLIAYFAAGVGFYVGLLVKNPKGFLNASLADIIRGLIIGLFIWPIGLVVSVVMVMNEESK